MRVKDDRVGIEPAVIEEGRDGHLGLQGMRERAARMRGKLAVESAANAGTEITVVVPGRDESPLEKTSNVDLKE